MLDSKIEPMISYLKIRTSADSPSSGGVSARLASSLTILSLSVALVVAVMVGPGFCLTVTTGPMQEYLFVEGKKLYDAGKLDRAADVWTNIFPDTVYGPVAYILLARGKHRVGNDKAARGPARRLSKNAPE